MVMQPTAPIVPPPPPLMLPQRPFLPGRSTDQVFLCGHSIILPYFEEKMSENREIWPKGDS